MKIIGLTLNGLNLISSDYYFSLQGLFDFEKNIITNELFIDGQSYNHSKINGKKLVLNGYIKTWDPAKIAALNQILYGVGIKQLVVNIASLGILIANVEVINRITSGDSRKVSVQLSMPDPYLYAQTSQALSLGALANASLTFPFAFPITFGSLTGGSGIITNLGNAVAYPVINIVGTCNTLTVTNTTTGESMSCAVSLGASDVLIIDSNPATRGIYLNGVSRMDLKNGAWPSCIPGDNAFTFSRNSIEVKQHCSISLQSRWV